MKRNLKPLGLALYAVLALGAVSASSASATIAHHIETTPGTQLSVQENDKQQFRATASTTDRDFTCSKTTLTGELPVALSTEVTVTMAKDECVAILGGTEISLTLTENGCHLRFTGETTHTEGETEGDHSEVHLEGCEEEKGITTHVTLFLLPCVHIPEQDLHGVTYTQMESSIKVQITVHGIHSTTTGVCEEEDPEQNTHTDGVYLGNIVVQGTNPLTLVTTEE